MAKPNDHGLETIKKAGEFVTEGDFSDYYIKVKGLGSNNEPLESTDGSRNVYLDAINSTLLTAFGRLKTATPTVIFEGNFVENDRPDLFNNEVVGGATVVRDDVKNQMDLTCGTASGDRATMQSFRYIKYTPGQSDSAVVVQKFNEKTNVTQRAGLFDDNDGFIFQLSGSEFSVIIRNSISGSVVENKTTQANFNIDPLDGTGPSGETINLANVQIFYVDFQWLGAGTVRFGLFVGGKLVFFHQEDHANVITATKYMRTATLPIRWEIINDAATASSTTLEASCCSVINDGGTSVPAARRTATNESAIFLPANGNFVPLISIRIDSTADVANLRPILFDVLAASPDAMLAQLVLGGTITGGAWVKTDVRSVAEYNETIVSFTGGIVLDAKLIGTEAESVLNNSQVETYIGRFLDGTSQTLTLRAKSLNNNAEVHGGITWEEVY